MRKNKVIQFSLVIVGILLFFFTYYSSNKKDKADDIGKNTSIENVSKLTAGISNIIENVSYVGTDNKGTFLELKAAFTEVFNDKPDISNMKVVDAVINVRNGRKIYIKSDYAIYNQLTNDAQFMGNILINESNNIITSDNLDLIISKNLITAYNNVKYNGEKGFLIADKVDIDILENEVSIFMFKKNDRVQVKYKN